MPEHDHEHKTLRRSQHPVIAGVCGGIAEYLDTDPVLVRVIFIFLALLGASGLILYLILWLIIPEQGRKSHEDLVSEVREHMDRSHRHAHGLLGFFIVMIGLIFLLNNFFPAIGLLRLWPIFLVFLGLALIS